MMETLHTLVRNIAVVLLLAGFLEMLLPNTSMRGFVKLVMGLFVISAVLGPITELLRAPLAMEVPAWTMTAPRDLPVMADGQGARAGQDAVQEQFRRIIVNQVQALAMTVKGVSDAQVEVDFEEGGRDLTDQPRISLIKIKLSGVKPIEPVKIGQPPSELSERAQNMRKQVASFMGLQEDKVIVEE